MNKEGNYVDYLNDEKDNSLINKVFFLHINITDEYPFKPPKILCNDINLLTIYSNTHNNPIKFLKKDIQLLTDTLGIMNNPETMKQIAESMEDINQGKVKDVNSVKDLISEM